ncbi:MAG: hypothetical protein ABIB71_07170 [Candidatus Woesearchaeota archaeon]
MHKRGQAEALQLLTLVEIVVGIAIIIFLVAAATGYNSFTKFNGVFLKEDLKMMLNSVAASPADVKVTYDLRKGYKLGSITDDDVEVAKDSAFDDKSMLVLEYTDSSLHIGRVEK